MLPDYPEEKQKLLKFWIEYLERKQNELLGPFSMTTRFTIHEGNRWRIERNDGSVSESEYNAVQAEFSIAADEAPTLTPRRRVLPWFWDHAGKRSVSDGNKHGIEPGLLTPPYCSASPSSPRASQSPWTHPQQSRTGIGTSPYQYQHRGT